MIIDWFLWLVIYSVIGWIYESTVCSIGARRFVNRGFLNGPYCPVYGFGALLSIAVMYGRTDSIFILFFAGMALTTIVEYFTAWLLEKVFKAKWWDYSKRPFNINGRVCLLGAVVFGVLVVGLIKYIHPLIISTLALFTAQTHTLIAAILFAIFAADIAITVNDLLHLNARLKAFQGAFNEFVEQQAELIDESKASLVERFENSAHYVKYLKQRFEKRRWLIKRIVRAYPKLKPIDHLDAWEHIKNRLIRIRQDKK